MKPISYLLLLCCLAGSIAGVSQKQQIRFEHLETNQGLSQSNVICILQDSRGFMWFGTRDGLNKYDGYKFTVYKNDPHNSSSISNNFIKAIAESRNGDIWITTHGGGICRYDRMKDKFTTYKHDSKNNSTISNDIVTSLREDSQGIMWIGTENGLNSFDYIKNKFVRYTTGNTVNDLSDNRVRYIFEDSRHNLWIGTFNGGLNLYNRQDKKFYYYKHHDKDSRSISNNNVYTMFEDSKHRLWIGTDGGGLDLFDKENNQFSHFKHDNSNSNSLASNTVYSINENKDHHLWIGTENGGLSILNPDTGLFQTYQKDEADRNSLNNNSVYAIYKDIKGNMWLGTFNGGVDMVSVDGNKFAHFKHSLFRNSLSDNNVLCIYEDSHKNIWIGTDGGGLNLFDPLTNKFTCFRNEKNSKNSICGNYVLSVSEDSKGNIWVGTWGNGVTVFNKEKNTFKHFKNDPADPSSLSNNNAWKIFNDKEGNTWVGTYGGGLNSFNAGTNSFTHYQSELGNKASISSNNVQSILEGENEELWVTTDGGGINLFDKKTKTFSSFLHDDKKNSIANNSTGSIFQDSNKNLWIGTNAGLSFLDKKTNQFTNYTTADGLPNNVVFGILEDSRHQLWVSTNKGISRFDPLKKTFKNFDISDGLQSNEFKQQAYCKSHTGKMYFGGNNGFNEFLPDSIKENSFVPPLVITGFQIFNKEVTITTGEKDIFLPRSNITETKAITISHSSSVISFEFASLNYTIAEKKQYEYMLEGFDQKWNNIGTRRTATYTNLDPGKYVFKVRGLNNDGTWSDAVTNIALTIKPPFWLTWWFKTLVALVVLGSVLMIFRVRVKVITKQKERLQQKVKERTDEVERQKEKLSANVVELEEAQKQMSSQMNELALLKDSLEKEKYYLDSLMDNMPDSIYFKDKDSKLMRVSKYMANHFRVSIEELIGKSDFDFQDEIHAREAFEDEQKIQKTRTPKIDYIEKEVRDGKETWVTTTKMPLINSKGEVVGTFGMSRDITKVKELEEDRHAAELDKAVAQGKFEIASDVMHDIGNAVVGFGSYITRIRRLQELEKPENMMALTRFFEENKPSIATAIGEAKADAVIKMLVGIAMTQRSNQEEISKSISEQLNIITHIQEILNIQRQYISGHESQERKPVNLRNIINDSISMVFASIDKLAIGVSLDMAPDLPIIKGDRTKLMQAILNILKNSIEAIDKNADKKTISLNAYTRSNELVLQIKDSGAGFDNSTAKQLFQRGFSTKTSGSGFGLYNCKSIIESHEGKIDITSEGPGKGTITTIGFKLSA